MKKILITIFGFLSIVSVAHASILGVQSGGTGASTLTGCLTGNGIQPITGTGSACGSGGGTGSSTTLIASTELWIDANATTTIQSGSIQYPFHTIDAANAYVTASSGILASGATYHIAPANYVELNSTLTMPNTALMIFAGKSTIITGYGAANGTINFPNQFSWNGGTILGSVTETDTSTSTAHSFEDDFAILGNVTCSGLCTLLNGVQLSFASTTAYYAPIGATSTLTIGKGALANILGENTVASIVDNGGTLNLNDDQVICTTSSYCITATTTGSIVEVLGLTLINPSGGGINVQNGATTVPNNLGNIIITDGVGSTPIISNAMTTTILNGYNAYSIIGQQQYAVGSGYIASDQIGLFTDGGSVLGSNVGGIPIGTTTIDDPFVASSTFAETNTATSTFAGGISATCFSTGSGCITGGGSSGGVSTTSPYSSGYVPYATSTGALTNSNIFQLGSNVGIGTTNPGQKLDVSGNINVNTNGTPALISTFKPASTTGNNIFIGGGGQSSVYDGTNAYTGSYNTSVGINALYSNTTGFYNMANGVNALYSNTTGFYNMANGANVLQSNTTGYYNTANGLNALYSNTTGNQNTANGLNDLYSNTTGYSNTANGVSTLQSNTTGSYNTAQGLGAGYNSSVPLQTMSNSTFLGYGANSSVDGVTNSTAIGNGAQVSQSNEMVLGNTSVTQTLLNRNVGIGTTTPATALDVNGNVTIEKANGIIMRDTVTGSCYIIKVTSGVLVPTASTTASC